MGGELNASSRKSAESDSAEDMCPGAWGAGATELYGPGAQLPVDLAPVLLVVLCSC